MLGSIISEFKTFVNKHDDDIVDRYNHRYTVMFISVIMLLTAGKQYFSDPIVW